MIYHHIEACAQVPGLTEVLLLGFYEESAFASFVEETSKELKLKIRYLNEIHVLGTAGGLYFFRNEILEGNPSNIFVLHADICCGFPLKELLEFHASHGQACTIMGTKVQREYANHYGCLVKDDSTHELLHYTEKPETFVSDLINCGVYIFSPKFFDITGKVMEDIRKSDEERLKYEAETLYASSGGIQSDVLRLEQDVFVPLAGNKQLYVYQYNGFWRQIKNAGASVYCNDLYTKHFAHVKPDVLAKPRKGIVGNVIIHPTAEVDPTAVIGPDVTIGAHAKIGKGVRVLHSIILDGVEVKDRACVLYSILAWGCVVGMWARIEGIPNHTPYLYHNEKRQGVTIFGREAVAEREITVRNCIVMPHKVLDHSVSNEILL